MMRVVRFALFLLALAACACVRDSRNPETARTDSGRTLRLDAALDGRFVPVQTAHTVTARLRISPQPPPEAARPPVNLALLVDTSGSMEGRAIDDAKKASVL